MPTRMREIYWLRRGDSSVRVYRPGLNDKTKAPEQGALMFATRDEANAIVALSECHLFLRDALSKDTLWKSFIEDDGPWLKAIRENEGDPLPQIKAWCERMLDEAITKWQQEEREKVMRALAGLASTTDDGSENEDEVMF